MSVLVDIHCHTFNADDLPVRGFVHRVAFDNKALGADVAALVDVLIQGTAPGYVEERRRLDALLSAPTGPKAFEAMAVATSQVNLEADIEIAFEKLRASEPTLVARIGSELSDASVPAAIGYEGVADWATAARRAIKWVKLFGMSRLDVTTHLIRNFADRVDLYIPLLVDLGMGLYDTESTPLREQMVLQEKISRLSMLGRLPGTARARVHPFIGFDPRRELWSRRGGDVEKALDILRSAIMQYGFVGVKLYPPMGWRPIDNHPTVDMTSDDAREVDAILRDFYRWCEQEQVPITTHCNASNEAHSDFREFSDPHLWGKVLEEFPSLHLNLGHFGGARKSESPQGWPWRIARLATSERPFLFADVGNHRIDRDDISRGYLEMLDAMYRDAATAAMNKRVMYGSDWYMLATLPQHEEFLNRYEQLYHERFGAEATEQFLGLAALRFLGFDDPTNKNAQRLRKRYETYAPDNIPAWLA